MGYLSDMTGDRRPGTDLRPPTSDLGFLRPVRVISDVHLRDSGAGVDDPELLSALETLAKRDPGRLVLNGDFFDFVKVTAVPCDATAFADPITSAERLYGLRPAEDRSAWKAERILAANPETVSALKDLVARGHEIIFVPGNHDAELRYAAVRTAITRQIDPSETGALSFPVWFYHEPGRLWIEHGSQYDRENALSDVDSPDAPARMPFGIVSSRYFANVIERRCGLPPSDMGPGGYFVWVFRNHGLRAFAAIARYFVFAAICLFSSGPFGRRGSFGAGCPSAQSAVEPGPQALDTGTAARIDALKATPILDSFRKTLMRLYLPQVSLTIAAWSAALVIAVAAPGLWWTGVILVLASVASLSLSRRTYTGRIREKLEDAAASISDILGTENVVFGHDHNGQASRAVPKNFLSSVWRYAGGPARLLEIPADETTPRIVLINPEPLEERT